MLITHSFFSVYIVNACDIIIIIIIIVYFVNNTYKINSLFRQELFYNKGIFIKFTSLKTYKHATWFPILYKLNSSQDGLHIII